MTQKYKKNTYHKSYTINFFISLHIKTSCKQNGKDSFCIGVRQIGICKRVCHFNMTHPLARFLIGIDSTVCSTCQMEC